MTQQTRLNVSRLNDTTWRNIIPRAISRLSWRPIIACKLYMLTLITALSSVILKSMDLPCSHHRNPCSLNPWTRNKVRRDRKICVLQWSMYNENSMHEEFCSFVAHFNWKRPLHDIAEARSRTDLVVSSRTWQLVAINGSVPLQLGAFSDFVIFSHFFVFIFH